MSLVCHNWSRGRVKTNSGVFINISNCKFIIFVTNFLIQTPAPIPSQFIEYEIIRRIIKKYIIILIIWAEEIMLRLNFKGLSVPFEENVF